MTPRYAPTRPQSYDHVPRGPAPPPDPTVAAGQCDFTFDRSRYRVPAIIVSPWVDEGNVINHEYRHTSMLATCARSGTSATRSPTATPPPARSTTSYDATPHATAATWPDFNPRPLPDRQLTKMEHGEVLSNLGKAIGPGLIEHSKQVRTPDPRRPHQPRPPTDANADRRLRLRDQAAKYFPGLVPDDTDEAQPYR